MAEPAGPFYLLQAGPGRYLCYCRPGPGPGGTVYVTDALEVWAGELGGGPALDCRCPPEEHGAKLREALGRGAAALSLGEGKATLQLREEARCSALELFKLPIAEARSQVQALVFGMAGRVESLERRLEAAVETLTSSYSPEKNVARSQQLFLPAMYRLLQGVPTPRGALCPRLCVASALCPWLVAKDVQREVRREAGPNSTKRIVLRQRPPPPPPRDDALPLPPRCHPRALHAPSGVCAWAAPSPGQGGHRGHPGCAGTPRWGHASPLTIESHWARGWGHGSG
ncbi:protein PAXX isoform X3 [Rissa tridactyla]|uniref:protein PAXX isoform X3 n=1 Tax=Rissa tridactyla TaxID=75485 RepID=UPI0023BAA96A|nr:protein PAXX isoform X3 [Rissa tridactyla]